MSSQKRLMVIGAKWEQIPLIEAAKARGCFVVATDPDPAAQALAMADEAEVLDPRDLSGALAIARRHAIDGVTADQCDYSRYAAVFVAAMLGLGRANFSAAQLTTNKRWMRERCREHQIFQPRFIPCRTVVEAHAAADLIGFPVIVKPVDNRGSFGVHRVDRSEDLQPAFFDAVLNAHSREVLVEAYVEGVHVTVDGCVDQSGRHHNLAIATKKVTAGDKPIITEVYYPARLSPEIAQHVLDTNSRVIDVLGITDGLTHSEYIVDAKGRCFLVETANRGGGVLTSGKIVPAISGVDVSALLVANALGESFEVAPAVCGRHVMLAFFVFAPGKVLRVEGFDNAKNLEGVLHVFPMVKAGQLLTPPQSGAGRHGFAIVVGDSEADVLARFERVQASIVITYDK
jgi:biotin carboxylase